MFIFTENFKHGDYIIGHSSGDMAVYDKTDEKGYIHFKYYYSGMFKELKSDEECKKYILHISYQKFFVLCNDKEKNKMDNLIKKRKKG